MTTSGWRPSSRSVARVWLKYASVYQPARIFSTGRSKISGSSRRRVLVIRALSLRGLGRLRGLECEARVQRGLCHFELLGARLARAEPVLQLVAWLRKRPRERVGRVP